MDWLPCRMKIIYFVCNFIWIGLFGQITFLQIMIPPNIKNHPFVKIIFGMASILHTAENYFSWFLCVRNNEQETQNAIIKEQKFGGGGYFKWFIFCCNYKILAVLQIIGTIEQKNVQINSTNFLPYMGTYMSLYVNWILNNSPFPTQD